jgi:hypothetical protein
VKKVEKSAIFLDIVVVFVYNGGISKTWRTEMDIEDEFTKIARRGVLAIIDECLELLEEVEMSGGVEETLIELIREAIAREVQ